MKLRESANDKSTLFKVNKSPYHMIREANIPDSTRNAHSSSHSNEDTSDLDSNRERIELSDSSSHSNEQKVGKFNMKLSATKQKVNRFDADKNDDDSDRNVVTDSSDYDKISTILGAAMLPPMEVHKPAKIYSSKAIKNSFTVDNNVRRSPSKTTHNPVCFY
ncbi:unnamed protein product [Anisakis simplex]|uniref:DUF4005 domain-containing protein n=1 Tax=Anisakis simplex TaxID=6269 RepID=A0A0M3J7Y3_ANISI|nr:unnamed protein product [Anisakis simplex]